MEPSSLDSSCASCKLQCWLNKTKTIRNSNVLLTRIRYKLATYNTFIVDEISFIGIRVSCTLIHLSWLAWHLHPCGHDDVSCDDNVPKKISCSSNNALNILHTNTISWIFCLFRQLLFLACGNLYIYIYKCDNISKELFSRRHASVNNEKSLLFA